jgi:hypothetical protein
MAEAVTSQARLVVQKPTPNPSTRIFRSDLSVVGLLSYPSERWKGGGGTTLASAPAPAVTSIGIAPPTQFINTTSDLAPCKLSGQERGHLGLL